MVCVAKGMHPNNYKSHENQVLNYITELLEDNFNDIMRI